MNKTEEREKRCLFCGKKLIDEKLPVCLRCKLKGRNTAGNVTKVVAGVAVAISSGKTLVDNSKKN